MGVLVNRCEKKLAVPNNVYYTSTSIQFVLNVFTGVGVETLTFVKFILKNSVSAP